MDNKKWSKRFSTIFWWTLTILPLIVALIYFIGYHFTFNSGITSAQELSNYHTDINGSFNHYLSFVIFSDEPFAFYDISLPFLTDMFSSVFENIGVDYYANIGNLFGWMASVQLYHVLYDVAVWLFRIFHDWLERWC